MRRPVAYLVVITIGLLALGAPFLGAQWGSVDERVLPEASPSRVAADLQAEHFGGETSSANIVRPRRRRGAASRAYAAELAAVDGVTHGAAGGDREPSTGEPSRCVAGDLVRQRPDARPPGRRPRHPRRRRPATARRRWSAARPRRPSTSSTRSATTCRGWRLVVVAVMLVLLFVAFGSVVLPLKAIVMNAVSIGASFGVVTWIFQEGHLSGLLGFTSPGLPRRDPADPDARDPVRAVDGLRGVPALPDPRGVGPHRRQHRAPSRPGCSAAAGSSPAQRCCSRWSSAASPPRGSSS